MSREDRAHELREIMRLESHRLIALYRNATGIDELGQLPAGVGFTSMIDAIIAHEVAAGTIDGGATNAGD